MEVVGCTPHEWSEAEIAASLHSDANYTIPYVAFYADGRWYRSKFVVSAAGWQQALDMFWVDLREEQGIEPEYAKFGGITVDSDPDPDGIAMVDEAMYGDEPTFSQSAFDRYAASTEPRQHFTVFGVWKCGGPDFVPTVAGIEAVDWQHAELKARYTRQNGEFLICGVMDLYVPTPNLVSVYPYATPDGKPFTEPEPQQSKRHWWQH